MTLQSLLGDTTRRLSVRTHIIATSGLLKLTLEIGFRLDQRDNLGMGLHQFGLDQNNSDTRKVTKAHDD